MDSFLTSIEIKKLLHLSRLSIDIDADNKKHLIITGKNGSGKTSLLKEISVFLDSIRRDQKLTFLNYQRLINDYQKISNQQLSQGNRSGALSSQSMVQGFQDSYERMYGKIELHFNDIYTLSEKIKDNKFLLAFYSANRKTEVIIPQNPEKPNLTKVDINQSKVAEFVKFLVDLKIQEALARNENLIQDADEIQSWFQEFNIILSEIFDNEAISLEFNYRDYSFKIRQDNKLFGFNELSDGYSAIIDIVADIILKMQQQNSLVRAYNMEGIVLIDEIETHLHLKLQRSILPMLTIIFPNLQFICTTHSPFILNSIDNAVAFDLEKNVRLEDLTLYSYESLAEGYFKVDRDSNFLKAKLVRFKELSSIKDKDSAEQEEYQTLDNEFSHMDELLTSPSIKAEYYAIKLKEDQA